MTADQIAELKRLWTAATQGKWEAQTYSNYAGWSVWAPDGAGCIAERWYPTGTHDDIPRNDLWIVASKNAFPALIAALEEAESERDAVRKENDFMRLRLAESDKACVYCSLPKAEMVACANGFPGCARADDLFHCDELTRRDERNKSIGAAEWLEQHRHDDWLAVDQRERFDREAAELRRKAGE